MALVFTCDLSKASAAKKYPKFFFNQRPLDFELKHFSVGLELDFTSINNDLLNQFLWGSAY